MYGHGMNTTATQENTTMSTTDTINTTITPQVIPGGWYGITVDAKGRPVWHGKGGCEAGNPRFVEGYTSARRAENGTGVTIVKGSIWQAADRAPGYRGDNQWDADAAAADLINGMIGTAVAARLLKAQADEDAAKATAAEQRQAERAATYTADGMAAATKQIRKAIWRAAERPFGRVIPGTPEWKRRTAALDFAYNVAEAIDRHRMSRTEALVYVTKAMCDHRNRWFRGNDLYALADANTAEEGVAKVAGDIAAVIASGDPAAEYLDLAA